MNNEDSGNLITFNRIFARPVHTASFTIVELLLVVLLLGVISGLAIPNFSSTYSNLQLRETSRDIAYLMRYAQNQSIINKCTFQIVFDLDKLQYWIVKENSPDTNQSNLEKTYERISGRFGRINNIPSKVTVDVEDNVTFYPDGTIDKTRIYISNSKNRHYTVSTNEQIGYVHVFDFKVE